MEQSCTYVARIPKPTIRTLTDEIARLVIDVATAIIFTRIRIARFYGIQKYSACNFVIILKVTCYIPFILGTTFGIQQSHTSVTFVPNPSIRTLASEFSRAVVDFGASAIIFTWTRGARICKIQKHVLEYTYLYNHIIFIKFKFP